MRIQIEEEDSGVAESLSRLQSKIYELPSRVVLQNRDAPDWTHLASRPSFVARPLAKTQRSLKVLRASSSVAPSSSSFFVESSRQDAEVVCSSLSRSTRSPLAFFCFFVGLLCRCCCWIQSAAASPQISDLGPHSWPQSSPTYHMYLLSSTHASVEDRPQGTDAAPESGVYSSQGHQTGDGAPETIYFSE